MSRDFELVLRTVARRLIEEPGSGGHVHFDSVDFAGIVPDPSDVAWLDVARSAASVLAPVVSGLLIKVPIGTWTRLATAVDLTELVRLEPWEPPGLYALPPGESAFTRRRAGRWYSDDVPQAEGALGWLAAYQTDVPQGMAWRLSLMYEI
jgi:hypothetical protein